MQPNLSSIHSITFSNFFISVFIGAIALICVLVVKISASIGVTFSQFEECARAD